MTKMNITDFLIKKAELNDQDINDPQIRARYGSLEGWVSVLANLVLFITKLSVGLFSGSISIIADAIHTLSDVATSAVVIWGFKVARKPADKEHPFGHGRMEDITTLIIAVLLCVVGVEILLQCVERISQPPEVKANIFIFIVLAGSAVVKEWMARFSFSLGGKIDSSALNADGWHHRSDAISTILVIIAVICSMFKLFIFDALLGGVVAAYIIYTGIRLVKEASTHLLGKGIDESLRDKIRTIAVSVDGVEGVHDIVAHDYGTHKAISLHVEVARSLNSVAAHRIAATVETRLAKNIVSSPIVHIDLKRKKGKNVTSEMMTLKSVIKKYPKIIHYHGVQMSSTESGDFLNLHIVIPRDMNIEQSHELEHQVRESLQPYFKDFTINMHVEPCNAKCALCSQSCKQSVREQRA
ncbi:MAG: cation diffusion facilitator family transporter [Candidatus Omnitrophota bacterium]